LRALSWGWGGRHVLLRELLEQGMSRLVGGWLGGRLDLQGDLHTLAKEQGVDGVLLKREGELGLVYD
jgi:hypothetical protein